MTIGVSKAKSKKPKADHPSYTEMVLEALKSLKERKGTSRQKVSKFIQLHYSSSGDVKEVNQRVVAAFRRMLKSGAIINTKGIGAGGSVKIVPTPEEKHSTREKRPRVKPAPKSKIVKRANSTTIKTAKKGKLPIPVKSKFAKKSDPKSKHAKAKLPLAKLTKATKSPKTVKAKIPSKAEKTPRSRARK